MGNFPKWGRGGVGQSALGLSGKALDWSAVELLLASLGFSKQALVLYPRPIYIIISLKNIFILMANS